MKAANSIRPSEWFRREIYYPWLVVAIAFTSVGMGFGSRSVFAVFLVVVIGSFAGAGAGFGPLAGRTEKTPAASAGR